MTLTQVHLCIVQLFGLSLCICPSRPDLRKLPEGCAYQSHPRSLCASVQTSHIFEGADNVSEPTIQAQEALVTTRPESEPPALFWLQSSSVSVLEAQGWPILE